MLKSTRKFATDYSAVLTKESLSYARGMAAWAWRDVVLRYRGKLTRVYVLNALGFGCQVAGIGAVLVYANALEVEKTFAIFGYELEARSSITLLVLFTCLVSALMVVSAVFTLKSRRRSVALQRDYETLCLRRLLVMMSRVPDPRTPIANELLADGQLEKRAIKVAKHCGLLVKVLLKVIAGLATIALAAVFLLWINFLMTAVLILLTVVAAMFLHHLLVSDVDPSKFVGDAEGPSTSVGSRHAMDRVSTIASPVGFEHGAIVSTLGGRSTKGAETSYSRMARRDRAQFVVALQTAASLPLIMLITGFGFMFGLWSWSILIAYVVACRAFLSAFAQVATQLMRAKMFHANVMVFRAFVLDVERHDSERPGDDAAKSVVLQATSIEGGDGSVEIPRGRVTYLLQAGPLRRAAVAKLAVCSVQTSGRAPTFWFTTESLSFEYPLREALGLSDAVPGDESLARIASVVPVATLDAPADPTMVSQAARRKLQLAAAELSGRDVVIFEDHGTDADRLCGSGVPDPLRDRAVILASGTRLPPSGVDDEAVVLVIDSAGEIQWCRAGWMRRHPEVARGLLSSRPIDRVVDDFDDNDDDDD